MEKRTSIKVHCSTLKKFKKVKVIYQAKIKKEITDNEFILDLLTSIKGLIL